MAITRLKHQDVISSSKCSSYIEQSGIYFLVHNNRVVYVGQSQNAISRSLGGHGSKKFDGVAYIFVNENIHLNNLEAYFIAKFKPKYNSSVPSNKLGLSSKHLIKEFDFNKVNHIIERQYGKIKMEGAKFKDYDSHINLHLVKEEYDYANLRTKQVEDKLYKAEKKFDKLIKDGYREIDRISNRINRLIKKERRVQEQINKKNSALALLKSNVKEMSEELSRLKDSFSVHSNFEPSVDVWNQNLQAIFGVFIKGIRDAPFYYFVSNNPKQELSNMREGNPKSKAKIMKKTFDFLIEQGVSDKIEIRFEKFVDDKSKTMYIGYDGFLRGREKECYNCNRHRTQIEEAENIFNDIMNRVISHNAKMKKAND